MTDIVARALDGERAAIARLISLAEAGGEMARKPLARIYQTAGKAHVIGITGPPGGGKSTLVTALAKILRIRNKKVGVIAIDPSSPFSGGAVLGDRVRMAELAGDDGVFIRSFATQGALGGLARPALDTADILDAAGFDTVLIETVGVGQDEVDVARAAATVLVVSAPGLGDGVQAIKAGVLEIADIHVITKADQPGTDKTAADLASALELGIKARANEGWTVPVLSTSAQAGTGIEALADAIEAHGTYLASSGAGWTRARQTAGLRLQMAIEADLRRALAEPNADVRTLIEQVGRRALDPAEAVSRLLSLMVRDASTF